ncbi:MAG: RNA polymerase sigma factor SigZ [Ketobacter sp.]|nr:RNA polymerase sigma factor SigZ [Ketobacter sp.]
MNSSNQIWVEYRKKLLGFIRSRVDPDDSEDILQNVFLKVHERIDTLQEQEKLESWLYQITRNSIIDYYRIRTPGLELPDWLNDELDEDNVVRRELSACLAPMIDDLPEKYRTALYVSEIEGKPQVEVAKLENISISGAKSRIQRGRTLLKQALNECCNIEINSKNQLVGYESKEGGCKSC